VCYSFSWKRACLKWNQDLLVASCDRVHTTGTFYQQHLSPLTRHIWEVPSTATLFSCFVRVQSERYFWESAQTREIAHISVKPFWKSSLLLVVVAVRRRPASSSCVVVDSSSFHTSSPQLEITIFSVGLPDLVPNFCGRPQGLSLECVKENIEHHIFCGLYLSKQVSKSSRYWFQMFLSRFCEPHSSLRWSGQRQRVFHRAYRRRKDHCQVR